MDFGIAGKMKGTIDAINEFVDRELIPIEAELVSRNIKAILPLLEEKRRTVKRMGLWAPNQPKEYGGMGLGLVDHALVSEALGRTPIGHYVFGCQAPDAGNMEILYLHGTAQQKEEYLKPLVQGQIRSCFSMTEPDMPGSNPVMLETTAVKDGDDFVINGRKWFSTAADGSAFTIVMAITDPQVHPYTRASMIIVPTGTKGYSLVRNIPVMGHAGEDFFSHGEVQFQSCRVPQKNLLGPEGMGFVIAQERLGPGRIHHCMRWIGICDRAFDLMCSRAMKRVIATDGKTLATKQIIQSWVAESAAEISASRLMVLNAAWKIEKLGQKEARDDVSFIKFFVANVLQRVIDRALQVHGGLGTTDDTVLAFFYRHERAARIYDGADEVHKMSVARRILRTYEGKKVQ